MESDLLTLLAARRGHFRLESGHHGDLWLDLDRLFLRPAALKPFIQTLAQRLAQHEISAVCGPLVGGGLLAHSIAAELDITFYAAERFVPPDRDRLYSVEYRLPPALHSTLPGAQVAIVDDVINAGSAVRGTAQALRAAGAQVRLVGALLVLGTAAEAFFAPQGVPVVSLAQLSSGLWTPQTCPLCIAAVPLEDATPEAGG